MHCALARPMPFLGVSCLQIIKQLAQKKGGEERKRFAVAAVSFVMLAVHIPFGIVWYCNLWCCISWRVVLLTSQLTTKHPVPFPLLSPILSLFLLFSPTSFIIGLLFYFFSCEASCNKVETLIPRDGNARTLPLTNAKQVRVAGNYALNLSLFDLLACVMCGNKKNLHKHYASSFYFCPLLLFPFSVSKP